jgi:hypothetical protein
LYKTINGGVNWTPLNLEVPSKNGAKGSLSGLDFLKPDNGYAAYGIFDNPTQKHGGGVLRTTDGGQSWISAASFEGQYVYDVDFVNADLGFVAVDDFISPEGVHILKTTNGGASWKKVLTVGRAEANPKILFSKNGTTGYVLYHSILVKTIDSGETWTISFENAIPWVDPLTGESEIVYWPIRDFALASKTGILIANVSSQSSSDLYRSDTGLTWTKVRQNLGGQEALSPIGSLGIHYSGDYGNYISTDYAQTWKKANIPEPIAEGFVPAAASIPSEHVAYLLDRHGKVLRYVKD